MRHDFPPATCELTSHRIRSSSHFKCFHGKKDDYDIKDMSTQQGALSQIAGRLAENRPGFRERNPNPDSDGNSSTNSRQCKQKNHLSIGKWRSLSRQYARRTPTNAGPQRIPGHNQCEIESKEGGGGHPRIRNSSKRSNCLRVFDYFLLQSSADSHKRERRNTLCGSKCDSKRQSKWISHQIIPKHADSSQQIAHFQSAESMERPEECWHCRDLNKEFNELRVQQGALEDLFRSVENHPEDKIHILEHRLEEQVKILHTKYKAETELYLHRVHTLHEQYSALHNRCINAEQRCIHAEDKIDALKKMLEKREASSSSSAKPTDVEMDPEGSTGKKISRIEID